VEGEKLFISSKSIRVSLLSFEVEDGKLPKTGLDVVFLSLVSNMGCIKDWFKF
jgi:hypothetical protein